MEDKYIAPRELPASVRLGSATYFGQFLSGQRTEVQVPVPSKGTSNDYSFKMVDASTAIDGARVLIFDGQLFGPNDEGYPSGMPSDDTYILPIGGDGYEVWVGYTYDESSGLITSRFIDQGPSTPDNFSGQAYVTLGAVSVNFSGAVPVCKPTNFTCGDIIIEVLPTDALDSSKNWAWAVDLMGDGNQKWMEICTS